MRGNEEEEEAKAAVGLTEEARLRTGGGVEVLLRGEVEIEVLVQVYRQVEAALMMKERHMEVKTVGGSLGEEVGSPTGGTEALASEIEEKEGLLLLLYLEGVMKVEVVIEMKIEEETEVVGGIETTTEVDGIVGGTAPGIGIGIEVKVVVIILLGVITATIDASEEVIEGVQVYRHQQIVSIGLLQFLGLLLHLVEVKEGEKGVKGRRG